jgi:prepilin-type N-terminal cleavage/methylation domain-containing protein
MNIRNELPSIKGFTLVELSIVLIIISLLIVGVSAGANLMKSSEINTVIADLRNYQAASANFFNRYYQYPGDMSNAASIWSTQLTNAACNGDNNNVIGTSGSSLEVMTGMVELAASKMISANIAPPGACGTVALGASNLAPSKVIGAYYSLINGSDAVIFQTTSAYTQRSGSWMQTANTTSTTNAVLFGKLNGTSTRPNNTSAYSTANAASIDNKIDDGLPGAGNLRAADGSDAGAAACTSASGSGGSYVLTNSGVTCIILLALS